MIWFGRDNVDTPRNLHWQCNRYANVLNFRPLFDLTEVVEHMTAGGVRVTR